MIIIKYGDAKKLESAKRWKCTCSKCGCKVILDKDDTRNYETNVDSGGHHFTKFYWACPYCETGFYYEEYDKPFYKITKPIVDKLVDFAYYHECLYSVIISMLAVGVWILVAISLIDLNNKHNDKTYNYKIQYDDDGNDRVDWTNKIEEKNGYVIYIDEDNHEKKQDLDTTFIINLKEEDK